MKFFDSEGHTLILRPDYTTPIARLVASRMQNAEKPLRLYYLDSVFRQAEKGKHQDLEIMQAGIELIGNNSPKADAEVIAICCEIISGLGFKNFGIDIGHTDFVSQLSEKEKKALINGNYLELGYIPDRGGLEIINEHHELAILYNELKSKGWGENISFNKGLIRDISYYSGIVFECYIPNMGKVIGSGGRYDNLISKFGYDTPAVGFSLDVNLLLAAKKQEENI
ncbi:ATP phosphoribosyltransferase regulatory subunit [Candidatus Margulisiibacteriota bacterium]